ncbi:MAG: XRE family transcriptional regulator [Chitinophagaceae bacterium]|nr:MAG: XRE family transcriptional regulator [Chitinophagaceae bacterium]
MGEDKYKLELSELGKRIRSIRKRKDLTQLDLELTSGINNGDISRIENGQKNLEFITIVKLADALGVELYELFKKVKE